MDMNPQMMSSKGSVLEKFTTPKATWKWMKSYVHHVGEINPPKINKGWCFESGLSIHTMARTPKLHFPVGFLLTQPKEDGTHTKTQTNRAPIWVPCFSAREQPGFDERT